MFFLSNTTEASYIKKNSSEKYILRPVCLRKQNILLQMSNVPFLNFRLPNELCSEQYVGQKQNLNFQIIFFLMSMIKTGNNLINK